MEEWVGAWWHRTITRAADRSFPRAQVTLNQMTRPIGALFRAGGGNVAMRIAPSSEQAIGGPRGWLQRVAGSGQRAAGAVWEPELIALPPVLAVFDDVALNRDLYLWLAALAAQLAPSGDWVADQVAATEQALLAFPGLRARHAALVAAHLRQRPDPLQLKGLAAQAERRIRAALAGDAVGRPGLQPQDASPVWLWLNLAPAVAHSAAQRQAEADAEAPAASRPALADARRRRAEAADLPTERNPFMLFFRAESLLSWSELVRVNRATDDSDDGNALAAANDMDTLALAPDGQSAASRVKFDLDLPSAAADDLPLGPGHRLPEWDWKRQQLRADHCGLQTFVARPGPAFVPAPDLRRTARSVRRRLEVLRAAPRWSHARPEGEAIDVDAWVRHATEGQAVRDAMPAVYRQRVAQERSLATLLLADLSLSTDAHVNNRQRVIDVTRDALYVFGEGLAATGDAFEMLGFSSVRRQHVRLQHLKGFDEAWGPAARQRVGAIKPGFYTRMGAAVREGTARLARRGERQRLLLLLTDGKPNDLDAYEGRYGLEDTRHAVRAARAAGLTPFCLTIDQQAHDYLPLLFGDSGFALVRQPEQLATRLAQVVARLTR
ncbi:nitric oxide reductase activation protein [Burkholderiales bacterium JOSHI_001]|nr:nitric oxide reductase activation protein [Burkholderiales bacterium JOSHI_001]